jgi:transposase
MLSLTGLEPLRTLARSGANDSSRSLTKQDSTIIAVIELSQSKWLVAALVPGVERQPLKKLDAQEEALLKLLHRWRNEAGQAGREIKRIVVAYKAGRDGFVAESYQSGETVSAIARRHGLTPRQLFAWRRASLRGAEDSSHEGGSTFAPVVVEAARPSDPAGSIARGPPSGGRGDGAARSVPKYDRLVLEGDLTAPSRFMSSLLRHEHSCAVSSLGYRDRDCAREPVSPAIIA